MNYLNIPTEVFRAEEFIDAEPVERATWIALMGWCASQENGGVISDCRGWSDRKWQQLAGVTKDEAWLSCGLYSFDGDDIVLRFYPKEQEEAVRIKREVGKRGGRPPKRPQPPKKPTEQPTPEPAETKDSQSKEPSPEPSGNHKDNHEANHHRNVKEGKGKERKGSLPPNPPPGGSPPRASPAKLPGMEAELPHGPRFAEAWADWCQHRAEIKKRLTPTAVRTQLKKLEKETEDEAVQAIKHSIANGYQGIFKPDGGRTHRQHGSQGAGNRNSGNANGEASASDFDLG